jgi:hypothetical protein
MRVHWVRHDRQAARLLVCRQARPAAPCRIGGESSREAKQVDGAKRTWEPCVREPHTDNDGREARSSLFVWLVADGWYWFVLREKYCWLVADDWFVLREKYCWLVVDKPNEQGGRHKRMRGGLGVRCKRGGIARGRAPNFSSKILGLRWNKAGDKVTNRCASDPVGPSLFNA